MTNNQHAMTNANWNKDDCQPFVWRLSLHIYYLLFPILFFLGSSIAADDTAFHAPSASDFKQVTQPRSWLFPRDHGRHDGYKTEWWYFTGNLRDSSGHRFGYQLTFFRTAIAPVATTRPSAWAMGDLYFAHAAITDIDGKTFVFKDRLQRGRAGLAQASDTTMDVFLLDWSAKLDEMQISHLVASEPGFGIHLTAGPGLGPVLQGPGGVNAKGKGPGQASYYYSEPRMPTRGSLTLNGQQFEVEGLSWMDHEFSSHALSNDQVGWDWMGLTLNDASSLMIYRLRNRAGGTDYLSGTLIDSSGKPRYLTDAEITLEGSQVWKSETGAAYPQQWRLDIAGQPPLLVKSLLAGQELVTKNSTDVTYFEGAVEVVDRAGRTAGQGYLEMTGYAKSLTGEKN